MGARPGHVRALVPRLGTVLLFAALVAAAPASAQSIRLDPYRIAQTPSDGFALSRPEAPHSQLFFVCLATRSA